MREMAAYIFQFKKVEIDGEWIPIAADLTVFHERDVQEMLAMLRQVNSNPCQTLLIILVGICSWKLAFQLLTTRRCSNAMKIW
jgi:hypothetical protein